MVVPLRSVESLAGPAPFRDFRLSTFDFQPGDRDARTHRKPLAHRRLRCQMRQIDPEVPLERLLEVEAAAEVLERVLLGLLHEPDLD